MKCYRMREEKQNSKTALFGQNARFGRNGATPSVVDYPHWFFGEIRLKFEIQASLKRGAMFERASRQAAPQPGEKGQGQGTQSEVPKAVRDQSFLG